MITITDEAAALIAQKTAKKDGAIGLRLNVKPTGCSGQSYSMEHVFEESAADDKFVHNGAVLYVPKTAWMLVGTTIGYEKKSMGQEGFTFNNPHVVSTCGCGESFQVDPALKDRKPT